MSEILGIEYFDRDIADESAKKTGLPVSTVSNAEETMSGGLFNMMFPLGQNPLLVQNRVFEAQREIILNLAEKESCIIVGRCSDYILEGFENHLRIFIYASYKQRMKNCVEALSMKPEEAKRMIREVDKARSAHHKHKETGIPRFFCYMFARASSFFRRGTAFWAKAFRRSSSSPGYPLSYRSIRRR